MNYVVSFGIACCVSAISAQSLEPHVLPELNVRTYALPPSELPDSATLHTRHAELGRALHTLPGVALRGQGRHGGEPVIRGLGWERVATRYNGLSLYGACPSRMDPPVSLFSAAGLEKVEVETGWPSVIQGPVPTGGEIRLSSIPELTPEQAPARHGEVAGGIHAAGTARYGAVSLEGTGPDAAWRADGGIRRQGDYRAGDGTRVPASRFTREASADLTRRLSETLVLRGGYRWVYEEDIEYIALPMDTRHSQTDTVTTGLEWRVGGDALRSVDLEAGWSGVDHLMDNRDKPNRGMLRASTPSESDSRNLRLLTRWSLADGELRTGIDASSLEREASRTRTLVSTGMTFLDPLWPEVEQKQTGLFGEWEGPLTERVGLRAGVRTDWIRTDAADVDRRIVPGSGTGPTTVRRAYQDVGRADSTDVDREDHLLSGNLALSMPLSETWTAQWGLGRTEAVPNLTQRYLSFGPVPGGYGVGTPTLDPEVKTGVELRTEGEVGPHRLGFAVHASRIDDFHLATTVAMMDVNGDGRIDRVRGTRNEDAELWGLEAGAVVNPATDWELPLSLGWVRGRTVDGHQDLPEMPPLEIRGAVRWMPERPCHPTVELGLRYAHKQNRVNEAFGEDPTPSFAEVHLRIGFDPAPGWRVEVGIDNLLDRTYHEHLTREALLPVGDLRPGDEVPAPGRSAYLNLAYRW
ncbi:MAG: TonB-dependent receptor [Kiritimatiellae bacterium]|jgi:iron complex outermembrane receptor protein|nr:TonB-dependent receptor [Kiritimatiellia bacterium]